MANFPTPPSLQKSLDATKVEYVNLGSSGLRVSWPILGTMTMGSSDLVGWLLDEEASLQVLKAAYDRGINTWDTANFYSNGLSEKLIGKAMRQFNIPRQKLVIMTKCSEYVGEEMDVITSAYPERLRLSKDYVNQGGLSRNAIFTTVENSLARLGTTYLDVLQISRFDPYTPPEETMEAFHDLVKAGKVRYIGASSMWATQFAEFQYIAEKNGWTKFISMQNYYNPCYREEEREMIRYCKKKGVGIMCWSPLFSGRLARPVGYDKSIRSKRPSYHHPQLTAADEEIIRRVEKIATEKGWSMSHVTLAWHKQKGTVPIVGLSSVEKVEDACQMRGKSLTAEEVAYIDEPYVARPVVAHS